MLTKINRKTLRYMLGFLLLAADSLFASTESESLREIDLTTLRSATENKSVVIHFWATWCSPCIQELPNLEEYIATLSLEQQKRFFVVSTDVKSPEFVREFLARYTRNLRSFQSTNPQALANHYGLRTLPVTLLLNAKGKERKRYDYSIDWQDADEATQIKQFLQATSP